MAEFVGRIGGRDVLEALIGAGWAIPLALFLALDALAEQPYVRLDATYTGGIQFVSAIAMGARRDVIVQIETMLEPFSTWDYLGQYETDDGWLQSHYNLFELFPSG